MPVSDLRVELIRASDGAHVSKQAYDRVTDPDAIAREIPIATRRELDLAFPTGIP
ncbi:MAG: hypothetical protein AAF481_17075 [Acidobacteriota bacterium]